MADTALTVMERRKQFLAGQVFSPEAGMRRMAKLGAEPLTMTPEAFNAYIRTEMEAAAKVAKAADLKAQ